MSNERSAEWLRGVVAVLGRMVDECSTVFDSDLPHITQGNLEDYLAEYAELLAAAEAREATLPTAAEVIEAFEKALATIADPIECGCKPCTGDCQSIAAKAIYFEGQQEVAADALAVIARWKEAK